MLFTSYELQHIQQDFVLIPNIVLNPNSYKQIEARMQTYIASKQNEKLLRVYLLKTAYDLTRNLEKQFSSTLASSCLIIRRERVKNQTQFGYKESLKTGFIKKIHFVYLGTFNDLITFLWAQLKCEKALTAGIMIESIQQYFGQRFNFEENGRAISICINLLLQLSQKIINKKMKMKVGFSFCYNGYVFQRHNFMNYMASSGITCWEIGAKQILKNGHQFENEWTKNFFEQYSPTVLKALQP